MLRAGALFVAVTISFVIAVLISLLITLSFQYKIHNRENQLQKKLERNASSAITLLMTEDIVESKTIDLYGEDSDSVQIKKTSWGVYEMAAVKAFSGRYSLSKTVEYGFQPDESLSPAIYMADLNEALNICGKTIIRGTCYFPERGYTTSCGNAKIYGEKKTSKSSLPPLDKSIAERISEYLDTNSFQSGVYKIYELGEKDTLINSFLDTTILIKVNGDAVLRGKYFSGNIIISSNQLITIDPSCRLEDVLLFSKAVKVSTGFTGNLQAFATDSILVEKECKLLYPSALGIIKKDLRTRQPFIKIMGKSELKGMIFTSMGLATDQTQTLVYVDKEAKITGQLYVDGFADIQGEIIGTIWCNKFYVSKTSEQNSLTATIIDRTNLSVYYGGSGLIACGKKKKIIKWLD